MNEMSRTNLPFPTKGLKLHGYIGLFTLLIAEVLMFLKVEPFVTFFYPFAWYGYILLVDSVVFKLKGHSLIVNRPKEFLLMLPWSVLVWLVFEVYNIFIQNWRYVGLPQSFLVNLLGYTISFATVLPGIFETTDLIEALGIFQGSSTKRWLITPKLLYLSLGIGIMSLILPFLFPKYTFPLVWGSFVFFLDPINYWMGEKSLLRDLENGRLTKIYSLLLAGLVCGFLWEFWNYWAGSKWVYTVPFVGDFLKVFEMPLLGFLGFPPFALECYVMYNFILHFQKLER